MLSPNSCGSPTIAFPSASPKLCNTNVDVTTPAALGGGKPPPPNVAMPLTQIREIFYEGEIHYFFAERHNDVFFESCLKNKKPATLSPIKLLIFFGSTIDISSAISNFFCVFFCRQTFG